MNERKFAEKVVHAIGPALNVDTHTCSGYFVLDAIEEFLNLVSGEYDNDGQLVLYTGEYRVSRKDKDEEK